MKECIKSTVAKLTDPNRVLNTVSYFDSVTTEKIKNGEIITSKSFEFTLLCMLNSFHLVYIRLPPPQRALIPYWKELVFNFIWRMLELTYQYGKGNMSTVGFDVLNRILNGQSPVDVMVSFCNTISAYKTLPPRKPFREIKKQILLSTNRNRNFQFRSNFRGSRNNRYTGFRRPFYPSNQNTFNSPNQSPQQSTRTPTPSTGGLCPLHLLKLCSHPPGQCPFGKH